MGTGLLAEIKQTTRWKVVISWLDIPTPKREAMLSNLFLNSIGSVMD